VYEVNNKKYNGKMKRSTPVTAGHHFEISYDPMRPSRNTGFDYQMTWFRVIVWSICAAIAGAIIYFKNH